MKYVILRADTIYWHNQEMKAKLKSSYSIQTAIDLWGPELFVKDPMQEYIVNGKAPLPDLLRTGSIAWLLSERFFNLLRNTGVKFEGFPIKLFDRKSQELVPKNYQLFHLLQVQPIIDLQKSHIINYNNIKRIELIPFGEDGPKMARDSYLTDLVFVREDLQNQIMAAEITGCRWQTINEFLQLMKG